MAFNLAGGAERALTPPLAEQFFEARQVIRFFQAMPAEEFDLAVQMQGLGVYSNPFTLLLGARLTAGFIREGDSAGEHRLLAHPVPCRPCSYSACPVGYTCLERVTVSDVVAAAGEAMALKVSL